MNVRRCGVQAPGPPCDRPRGAYGAVPWLLGAIVLAVAAGLRIPWLDSLPTPAGDEGNWPTYGLMLLRGRSVALAPDARFVTLAFARLIALAFRLGGVSFASARAVLVSGSLAGVMAGWVLARKTLGGYGAMVTAAVLAVHPWAVLWSRTASVPYALSLALATVGPLGLAWAVRERSAVGAVLAGQVLAVGLQFSPLALIPMVACALWALRPAVRASLGIPAVVTAGFLAALHLIPVVYGARGVFAATRHAYIPRPETFMVRLLCFVRMVVGELSGEATAAHFAGRVVLFEIVGAVMVVCVAAVAIPRAWRNTSVGSLAVLHLGVALLGLPLLLLPGRAWNMPTIDAERYGFVLLAPFTLVLAAAVTTRGGSRWVIGTFIAWLLCVPTARSVAHFVWGVGGHGDQGLFVMQDGGRYRGWQRPAGTVPLPDVLRATVVRAARGEWAMVVYEDYAFHALRFANARVDDGRLTPSLGATETPVGRLVFTVVWADEAFAAGYEPAEVPEANRALRGRLLAAGGQRVSVIQDRDGAALCEVWVARPGGRAP